MIYISYIYPISCFLIIDEFSPFFLVEPDQAVDAVKPPDGMSDTRFAKRYKEFKKLLANSPIQQHGSEHHKES